MAFEIEIQERIIQFAARIIKFCDILPKTNAGTQIAKELLRSGIMPAALHSGAVHANDSSDAIRILTGAVKDLNESEVWLRIIIASEMLPENKAGPLLEECQQLQRILTASIKTVSETAG
jgi:four helix bundle protein